MHFLDIKKLIKLANKLDQKGFYGEADEIDAIIKNSSTSDDYRTNLGLTAWNYGLSEEETKLLQRYSIELKHLKETGGDSNKIHDLFFNYIMPLNNKIVAARQDAQKIDDYEARRIINYINGISVDKLTQMPDDEYRQIAGIFYMAENHLFETRETSGLYKELRNKVKNIRNNLEIASIPPEDRPGGVFGDRIPKD